MSSNSLSAHSPGLSEGQALTIDDEDEEVGDSERLKAVKTLLFNTYRMQNKSGMLVEDFIRDLDFIFKGKNVSSSGGLLNLYHTLLNVPQ